MNFKSNNLDGKIIKKLFVQCVDLLPDEQIQIITEADVSEETKKHILGLLQHSLNELDLTKAVVDSLSVSLDIKPLEQGMKVGAYELQNVIGTGGQGEVWKAKRVDGKFNHMVAIKFLKPVHDQMELSRFKTERELLASLNHPNIAQLLDGGELENHRPYMVLELVEGLPILEYAKQQQFDLKKYLDCFIQICDAISYAHTYSVIHRDIKPSNILISSGGVVKVIDFGIAKHLEETEKDSKTLPVMTLAYSSPEQISGARASTATDVYALGLLLYEMLSGQRAQAFNTSAPADLVHEITDKIPNLPSLILHKNQSMRIFNSQILKGDLDKLVMMALRKEPERRYSTVQAMCNDVHQYLLGKPLIAVGDSWSYQTRKFIKRNPVSSILAALVLAFFIAFPLFLINNQQALKSERDKALLAQKTAQEQTLVANRTTDFLVSVLESASPLGDKGEQIKLDEVLTIAERQLLYGLDNQPLIKSNLLGKIASIRHHMGNTKQALEHYKQVLKIYQNNHDLSGQLNTLGQLAVMANMAHLEDLSIEYKVQADAIKAKVIDPRLLAWHDARMATLANEMNQSEEVEPLLKQTLANLKLNNIQDPELLGRIYNEMTIAAKEPKDALEYANLAMSYAKKLNGKMHPLYLNRKLNRANAYKRLINMQEAEIDLKEVLINAEKLYTRKHWFFVNTLLELGSLYHDLGRFSEVEPIYLELLKTSKEILGIENINYVLGINNLAYLYEDMGQFEKAEPLYRKSIALRHKYHSKNPYRIASSEGNLARLLSKMGYFKESAEIINRIIPIFEKHKSSNRQNHITAIANLIGQQPSNKTCEMAIEKIKQILPEVYQTSEKSWRRMYNELWLGEMATNCQNTELANELLNAASKHVEFIYTQNSDGQKMIKNRIKHTLNK